MSDQRTWRTFPPERDNILFMFHEAQRQDPGSHIPEQSLADIAEYLGMSMAEAEGVLSFYQAFSRRPRGKHVIRLCDSLSCRICGSLAVYHRLREKLGIGPGETTPDGRYSFEIVNCLGCCDTAPNVMVDDRLYRGIDPGWVARLDQEVDTDEDPAERPATASGHTAGPGVPREERGAR